MRRQLEKKKKRGRPSLSSQRRSPVPIPPESPAWRQHIIIAVTLRGDALLTLENFASPENEAAAANESDTARNMPSLQLPAATNIDTSAPASYPRPLMLIHVR